MMRLKRWSPNEEIQVEDAKGINEVVESERTADQDIHAEIKIGFGSLEVFTDPWQDI